MFKLVIAIAFLAAVAHADELAAYKDMYHNHVSDNKEDVHRSINEMYKKMNIASLDLSQLVPAGLHTRDACDTALTDGAAAWSSAACDAVRVDNFGNLSSTVQRAALQQACPAGCHTKLQSAIAQIRDACPAGRLNIVQIAIVEAFNLASRVWCLESDDGTEFCFPKLKEYQEAGFDRSSAPTAGQLSALCDTCTFKVINVFAGLFPVVSRVVAGVLQLVCLKDGATWCSIEFSTIGAMPTTTVAQKSAKVTQACGTRCFPMFLAKVRSFALGEPSVGESQALGFNLLCNKNLANELCVVKLLEAGEANNVDGNCGTGNVPWLNICSAGCKTAIQAIVSNTGCCAANYVRWRSYTTEGYEARKNWIEGACAAPLPATCPGFTSLLHSFRLRNLAWAWVVLHLDEVKAAIIKDLAAQAGVDEATITVTLLEAPDDGTRGEGESGTTINANVEASSTSESTSIQGALAGETTYINTALLGNAAKIDPYDELGASQTVEAISGASALVPAVALVVAVVAALY